MLRFTLALCLLSGAALAQTNQDGPGTGSDTDPALFLSGNSATILRGSELINRKLFATPTEVRSDWFGRVPKDWVEVGVVRDMVIPLGGGDVALVLDARGKTVAVRMSAVRFVMDGTTPEDMTDMILVITAPPAALQDIPAFDPTPIAAGPQGAPATSAEVRMGYLEVPRDSLTAELLQGAEVLGPDDSRLGTVAQVRMAQDGRVGEAIADFDRGPGTTGRQIAVPVEQLTVLRRQDSGHIRVYVDPAIAEMARRPTQD